MQFVTLCSWSESCVTVTSTLKPDDEAALISLVVRVIHIPKCAYKRARRGC